MFCRNFAGFQKDAAIQAARYAIVTEGFAIKPIAEETDTPFGRGLSESKH